MRLQLWRLLPLTVVMACVVALTSAIAESGPHGDSPKVSALSGKGVPLTAALKESSFGQLVLDSNAAHPVRTESRTRFFLAAGKSERICLLADGTHAGPGQHTWGVCAPIRSIGTHAPWVSRVDSKTSLVAAILPDGYSRAVMGKKSVDIKNNVLVEKVSSKGQTVRFEGDGVKTRTQRIG